MSDTLVKIIAGGLIALLLFGVGFCTGYKTYPKLKPCPVIDTITIVTEDPYWHNIADSLKNLPPEEIIKWQPVKVAVKDWAWIDSVMKANEADTAAILANYYSTYTYSHPMEDDTIVAVINTVVTKNQPIYYGLDYRIKIPFTTTTITEDNSITYNKYVYAGITVPMCFPDVAKHLDETTVDLIYAFPKGYFGAGYQGLFNNDQDYLLLKGGVTIFKFKQRK